MLLTTKDMQFYYEQLRAYSLQQSVRFEESIKRTEDRYDVYERDERRRDVFQIRENAFKYFIDVLAKNDINGIFLKGVSLNKRLFHNEWCRKTSDFDILLKENTIDKFAGLLLNDSFRYGESQFSGFDEDIYVKFGNSHQLQPLFNAEMDCVLEIHRMPFSTRYSDHGYNTYHLDIDKLFDTCIDTQASGTIKHAILNPEYEFIQLIMHFVTHAIANIRAFVFMTRPFRYPFNEFHLCALYYCVYQGVLTSDGLCEKAREIGVEAELLYALNMISEIYKGLLKSDDYNYYISHLLPSRNPNVKGERSFKVLFYNITQSKLLFDDSDIISLLSKNVLP